jgi:hypothetical protein
MARTQELMLSRDGLKKPLESIDLAVQRAVSGETKTAHW